MNNRPVIFIDSGVGGLPYCRNFLDRNPQESVIYTADRLNFPYGQKKKEDLIVILTDLTEKLIKLLNPKVIVLACNTASISALGSLRENFPLLPFVGTVPAIKPAAKASGGGKVGVLGTSRTIEDDYIQHLGKCEIFGVAAPELAEFVEQRFDCADEEEKTNIVRKYVEIFRAGGVNSIVLGCTHFLYLIEEFKREASPSITIFDSLEGITNRIETLLNENGNALRASALRTNSPCASCGEVSRAEQDCRFRLLLTGTEPIETSWKKKAEVFNFTPGLLCEI